MEYLIQQFLKQNNLTGINGIDYTLRDDWQGAYVDKWNYKIPKPTFTQSDFDKADLQKAKTSKITQLKLNRDNANIKDMVCHQAFELKQIGRYEFVETTNLVYFAFKTTDTGQPATQPDTIVQNAIAFDQPMRYSCKIIEGDQIRKGYVSFDRLVAISIKDHWVLRNTDNITKCNNIEIDIDACTTIEEINAINIEF